MSNDLYKSVVTSDGEGITYGDLNDAERFSRATLFDQIIQSVIGSPGNGYASETEYTRGADVSVKYAYCLAVEGALPIQGSANNKVKIAAGTLFQKVGTSDGNDVTMLPYTFDGTLEFTLANGDGTHPRVDMVQMKLELEDGDSQSRDFQDAVTGAESTSGTNKKHRVKATISVKAGTPAASPTYPTPDSGYVPICCVVVGTSYVGAAALKYEDTAGATAVLHDLRMPIKIEPVVTHACNWLYDSADWVLGGGVAGLFYLQANATVAGKYLMIPCPVTKCRIVGFNSYVAQDVTAGAGFLGKSGKSKELNPPSAIGHTKCLDIGSILAPGGSAASNSNKDLVTGSSPVFSAGPTIVGTADYQVPLWGNGERCYRPQSNDTNHGASTAGAAIATINNFIVEDATFYIARGL